MRWNRHYEVEGRHAFLGASKYHWINYDIEKMKHIWENKFAAEKGTRIHRIAADLIKERIRLAPQNLTLNMYVNDSIGFRMDPEQVLVYSLNCFGTPDAISYDPTHKELRIHDLKTGQHPGSFNQLMIYAALFCHEYGVSPYDIKIYLRIYQTDQMFPYEPDPNEIKAIMDKMDEFDPEIEKMKEILL